MTESGSGEIGYQPENPSLRRRCRHRSHLGLTRIESLVSVDAVAGNRAATVTEKKHGRPLVEAVTKKQRDDRRKSGAVAGAP